MELDFRFEDEDDYEYEIFSIPSRARAWASVIKDFKKSIDADGNENVKKTVSFISKATTLHVHHAFLYISLPVFARLRRERA